MSDDAAKNERWTGTLSWLLVPPFLFVLYVLSIGPVGFIAEKAGVDHRTLRAFYTPVVWLHHETPLQKPLEKWGELWGWN